MPTNSLRHDFHTDVALTVLNEIQYKKSNYYYFLGKIEPWGIGTSPELIQPDSESENNLIRSNAVFVRKITPNDVSLVTTRYNWITGTVYEIYDHTKNLKELNFYVVTDENNVYKCLNNNAGEPSTVKPTGKSFYTLKTSDNYLWKYMYTVPSFKRYRFMSVAHLPVQRALSDSFYNKGTVDAVYIENSGSGYADALLTTVEITGTTSGSGAVATINCGSTGNITSVTITNGGSGYTHGVALTINTIAGSGGILTPVIAAGIITGITVTAPGVGYVTGQSVIFSIGGGVIIPSVSSVTGSITKLTILNPGAGYTGTPTLAVVGDGTGKYGNLTALAECVTYEGSIVIANIIDPGVDYLADNNTTLTVQGDGIDAQFSPVIYNGEIIDVVIENPGSGYTSMTITAVGTGTDAIITPIISTSDFTSEQSIVEQTVVHGPIYSIVLTEGGDNYSVETAVTIVGDGLGATAVPVITNGVIIRIDVETYGLNYTYASVLITDPLRSGYANLTDAVAYPIIAPVNGHGYNAVKELFGDTLAFNSSLRQDTNLNMLLQDYRQFGLIKNPTNILTGKFITDASSLILYKTTFDTTVNLVVDELLIQNNIKFRVASVDNSTVYLQQLGSVYINLVGSMYAETDNARVYTINSIEQYPTVNKYSGNLLYIANENAFTFSEEQGIIIKTFLKF